MVAEFIKGYTTEEATGKNFRVFYTKEDQLAGLPRKLLNEARNNGRVHHEGWRVRKDGSRFLGSVVITALHNENDDVIGYSKVTRDLTDKKHAEDALKQNAAQLDLKSKALERLNGELSSFTVIEADALPVVKGVNFQMYQLFLNLISNALKFSRDSEPPFIKISVRRLTGPEVPGSTLGTSNRYHLLSFTDRGIGFPQEQSSKIFEAFHRLNKKGPISGSGVGLAIVKKIVENHDRIISAESVPDQGAVFNIYLPF
jgi:PAS domain S-box-containing protein